MNPTANLDWLYTLAGWTIASAGLLLLLWALFRDRSRGRRRCPTCWYDMAGVPGLQCPECGREARNERQLQKTRRRWKLAFLALAVLAGAQMLGTAPSIRARGWWAAVPRPILACTIPWIAETGPVLRAPGSTLEGEIRLRFLHANGNLADLWPGERAILRTACIAALRRGGERAPALAAALLVCAAENAVDIAPEAGRARVVLARSALMYRRCSSYRDVGLVKGSIGVRDERPFLTAFTRDGAFRFEFLSPHPSRRAFAHRYVVWGTGSVFSSWWTIRPNVGTFTTLEMALAGPTGVSGGSANNVPSQLSGRGSWITAVTDPAVRGTEVFDNEMCYVIRGNDYLGLPIDIWISMKSFALRKLHQHWVSPSVTVYRPEFDVAIPADLFTFEPQEPARSPLADGEDVAKALSLLAGDPHDGAVPVPPEIQRTFSIPQAPKKQADR